MSEVEMRYSVHSRYFPICKLTEDSTLKTNAENDNLNEPSGNASGQSEIKPRNRARARMRMVFGVAILLLGFLGVALWKFAPPAGREVILDLKNGYTIAMQIPSDWRIDEKATKSANLNRSNSNIALKEKHAILVFKYSKPTGLHAWIMQMMFRSENVDATRDINLDCVCHSKSETFEPKAQRDQEMMQKQNFWDQTKQIHTGVMLSNSVFSKYDSLPFGYGYEIVNLPSIKSGQKNRLAQNGRIYLPSQMTIYSLTPDNRLSVYSKIMPGNPGEPDRVAVSAMHLLASSMKFVPTNSNSK